MAYRQRDTTLTKIFVGGLPYHTTDQSLREFFDQFGHIEEAVVITDRQTGKSRGYGFVTMSDPASAEKACKDANPTIDGRKANVNLAYLGAKPRTVPSGLLSKDTERALADIPAYGQVPPVLQPQYVYPGAAAYIGAPGMVPVGPPTGQPESGAASLAPSHSPSDKSSPGLSVDCNTPPASAAAYPAAAAQLANGYNMAYHYAIAANQLAQFGYPYTNAVGMHPSIQQITNLHQMQAQQQHLQLQQLQLLQQQQQQQALQPQQQPQQQRSEVHGKLHGPAF